MSSSSENGGGVVRWLVNTARWDPSPQQFSSLMSFLPLHEHSSITKFVKMEDRKRAIVSRLLQYALVNQVLGIPFHDIAINRTPEGKPYLENDVNTGFPSFNFNVSHHGDYVAIASEPICLVGLDLVARIFPRNETVPEFVLNFSSYFSSQEWEKVVNAGSEDDILDQFYRYWCLKEAFVKALGTGVGHRLDCVEFHHNSWRDIYLKVDGVELKDWKFLLFELPEKHLVAVARGHPRLATETYKKTLKQSELDEVVFNLGLNLPNPSFTMRSVEGLIPSSMSR